MPSRSTEDERRFEIAISEQRVAIIEEEQLKQALRYVYAVVGIRGQNLPTGVEKEFLHQYIRTHYGGHTPSEIRLAFDMAIQGKLELAAKDVKCYENFSIAYFATIMGAYRKWAVEQAKVVERQAPPSKPPTKDQLVDIAMDYARYLFNQINKLPYRWPREV